LSAAGEFVVSDSSLSPACSVMIIFFLDESFQGCRGAIAARSNEESAFSHRNTMVEFVRLHGLD
jgi:hypothetical protein